MKSTVIHMNNPEDYRVVNQEALKQVIVDEPEHNACWDANLAPDGTLYFSVCSEHCHHEFAKLYRYDFESNKASECFYTRDYLLKSPRYLRDSKFHTSINFKPDGKVIMVTHSTDKSPCHPAWLPYAFVSNPFEGFPGGELIEYDPKTKKVELFGIPAPRETIYGAVYSPKDDAYYMLGWMRGHLYRFDCKTRKCEDKGQCTGYKCYRIVLGPDKNLYFSTKSGDMMRYNVDLQKIEDLNFRIPSDKVLLGKKQPFAYMGPCVTGPDGRMYTTGNFTSFLTAFDPKTGKHEVIGNLFNADDFVDREDQHSFVAGMDFDKDGVLWYSSMSFRVKEDEHYKIPSGMFRWDIFHGGKPEYLGLFGTTERVQTYTDSFIIDKKRDILYSVSTNHSFGSPDVIAIDLARFRSVMYQKGDVCRDELVYDPGPSNHKDVADLWEFAEMWEHTKDMIAEYTSTVRAEKIQAVRLWKEWDMDDIANARPRTIHFINNDELEVICGETAFAKLTVKNGLLTAKEAISKEEAEKYIQKKIEPQKDLPYYPGRSWRANAVASAPWHDGEKMVGTEDGFLAKVRPDGSVYSIGPAICQGPIRDMVSNSVGKVLYGVGGDVEDIGNLFRYTEEKGLEYLGFMCCDRPDDEVGTCAGFVPSVCAISPDGTKVAVGVNDRLTCLYLFTKPL